MSIYMLGKPILHCQCKINFLQEDLSGFVGPRRFALNSRGQEDGSHNRLRDLSAKHPHATPHWRFLNLRILSPPFFRPFAKPLVLVMCLFWGQHFFFEKNDVHFSSGKGWVFLSADVESPVVLRPACTGDDQLGNPINQSMGDLQDPTDGGTVPYFWPYFVGIFPYIGLKNRPHIW